MLKTSSCRPRPLTGDVLYRFIAALMLMLLVACGGSSKSGANASTVTTPSFAAATFSNSTSIDNPHFPMAAEQATLYRSASDDGLALVVIEILDDTQTIMGVDCVVVVVETYEDGNLVDLSRECFAEDDAGNVWLMAEQDTEFDYDEDDNLIATIPGIEWEAGLDLMAVGSPAEAGFAMPAQPMLGESFRKAYYQGLVDDVIAVTNLALPVTLADGSTVSCLQIEERSGLDPSEMNRSCFASGLGLVLATEPDQNGTIERLGTYDLSAAAIPVFSSAVFSNPSMLTNNYFPSSLGATEIYVAETEDETEIVIVERLSGTRAVMGIPCARLRDRVFKDDLLIEDTEDWYAQDDAGNVWYMGEAVVNYQYDEDGNLLGTNTNGSWETGLDIVGVGSLALPGIQMFASPSVGQSYRQEYYEDEAVDAGLIIAVNQVVTLQDGRVLNNCLQTLDWNPLDRGGLEYKFYAPGLGLVSELAVEKVEMLEHRGTFLRSLASLPSFSAAGFSNPTSITNTHTPWAPGATWEYEQETEDGTETIDIAVLPMTRVVAGVTCAVIQDEVFLNGVLIEDTFDWFAQDDAGNVWYLGEDVTNYVYDEFGTLLGTNSNGSWEAGLDVAGVGSLAEPGYGMPNNPAPGSSYFQEYYLGEAEDMAYVVALGVTVELGDGTTFSNCLQTLDWNPLDPSSLEYKFYAPGVGLVKEIDIAAGEEVELTFFSQ